MLDLRKLGIKMLERTFGECDRSMALLDVDLAFESLEHRPALMKQFVFSHTFLIHDDEHKAKTSITIISIDHIEYFAIYSI